jgi:FtsZ-binding cell division protein ZapB
MIYDISYVNNRQRLLKDAAMEGDDCPVDDVCDSIPLILQYIANLEEKQRALKTENQRLNAEVREYERKVNNLKSQKFRQTKKRGKTLHN